MSSIYDVPAKRGQAVAVRAAESAPRVTSGRRNFPVANAPGRLVADWASSELTANQALFSSLRTLRNRVRQLARENDLARRFITVMKAKVVGGEPVGYQAKARDPISKKLDRVACDILEAAVADFSRRAYFTASGGLSRNEVEQLVVQQIIVDGEFLARKLYGHPNKYGFTLQLLDPANLDESYNVPAGNGQNAIKLGIEVDKYNKPVAYWFREERDVGMGMGMVVAGDRTRMPAQEIIHVFITERVNQLRGVTWLCSVGLRMKLLDGYETAVTVGARAAAAKMGFLVNKGAEYQPDVDENGNPVDGMLTMSAAPGSIEQIPDGLEFQPWDPGTAPATMAEFSEAMKQGIASGVSMSYPTLASNLKGVSYSSIRKGDLDDKDVWRVWQGLLVTGFDEAWIEDFLRFGMLTGVINLPVSKIDKFAAREWWPRTWEGVDPVKTIEEKKGLRELGVSNTTILREMGYDIETEAELIEREPKTMMPWSAAAATSPSVQQADAAEQAAQV